MWKFPARTQTLEHSSSSMSYLEQCVVTGSNNVDGIMSLKVEWSSQCLVNLDTSVIGLWEIFWWSAMPVKLSHFLTVGGSWLCLFGKMYQTLVKLKIWLASLYSLQARSRLCPKQCYLSINNTSAKWWWNILICSTLCMLLCGWGLPSVLILSSGHLNYLI